jgi:uncharacterized protein
MPLSPYLKIFPCPDHPGQVILFAGRRAAVVRVPESTLKNIADGTLPEADRITLARLGVLVEDPAAEREELLRRFEEANLRSRRFHATVVVNLACNLACPYCFEEGVTKGAMTVATADALVAMIERDHLRRGREVALDFYGGEPLLSLDLVRSVSRRLGAVAATNSLPYEFSVVTNGTLLTRSVAEELRGLGLKNAKITLDGPRAVHDRSRPFGTGNGSSFDAIIGNIQAIWDVVNVQLGGNFTRENYRDFPRLLDDLLAVGITPEKVGTVHFNQVMGRIGSPAVPDFADGCNATNEEWLSEATLFLREETLKRGFDAPKPRPAGCMVQFDRDLVVNVDGTLYKCPAFVGREGFSVGDVWRGVVDGGAAYGPDVWKKPECLNCAYLPLCFGGCRFLKYLRDGRIDDVDCWRPFLDATLEGFVRQDLARKGL